MTEPASLTPAQLNAALRQLDLTQARFADLTGLHFTTVNNWTAGRRPVPAWVSSWLEMRQELHRVRRREIELEVAVKELQAAP